MKNHSMDSVVEAYLVARPECRRSDDELLDMDARDQLRNVNVKTRKKDGKKMTFNQKRDKIG